MTAPIYRAWRFLDRRSGARHASPPSRVRSL